MKIDPPRVSLAGPSAVVCAGLRAHALLMVALGSAPLATAGCGDPCPEELLPGICAESRHSVPLGYGVRDAVLADLDGDGSSELVSVSSRELHVAWRDGRQLSRAPSGRSSALVAGDFDGDGRPELALDLWDEDEGARLGFFAVEVSAEGELNLAELDSVRMLERPALSLWAGDLDADGRDEILAMDREAEAIVTVDGRTREVRRTPLGAVPVGLDLGDLDGDGALDLAVADFLRAELLVLRGDGAGGFAQAVAYPSALGLTSVAFGDLNGDGADDLVGRGGTAEVWLHPGDGAGGLGEPSQIELVAAGEEGSGIAIVPPGSDGIGGVMVPEEGALSTYLIDPDGAAIGRSRGRASAARIFGLRLRRANPGAWLLLGENVDEIELAEEPRPVEVWRRRAENTRLDRWPQRAIGDVDLDGVPDIVAIHETREREDEDWVYRAEVFLGDGDGQFSGGASLDAELCQSLVVGDFDGDGVGDVLGLDVLTAPWVSFGEGSPSGTSALPVGEGELWAAISALEGPTRARIVVEVRRLDEDGSSDRLEVAALDGAGGLTEKVVLSEGRELLGHWLGDLDGDGDDDLVAIAWGTEGRVLLSWLAEDETLLPGPTQSIAELVGWADELPLVGVGVGVIGTPGDSGEPELIIAAEDGLVRIQGIYGPAPTVVHEAGRFAFEDEQASSLLEPLILNHSRIERLTVGDLDGDEASDLLRCGQLCSVIFAGDDGLAGDAEAVSLPSAIASLDLDDDGRLDFIVGDEAGLGAMLTATHAGPKIVEEWPSFAHEGIFVGDLDGDGGSELVVATPLGVTALWGIGGDDEHGAGLAVDWGEGPRVRALADLDHDGRDELILGPVDLPGEENALAVVCWDRGRLRLEALDAPGLRPRYDLQARDLDGDGVDDLIATDRDSLRIAYGIDARRFSAAQEVDVPSVAALRTTLADEVEVQMAELNHDGHPELLRFERGQLTVLWGRPERAWGASTIEADGVVIRGDDLLIRRADTLYRMSPQGESLGQARRVIDDPQLAETDRMISGGDLDGDGLDDLLTVHGGDLWIWLSRGAGLRAPYVMRWLLPQGNIPTIADVDGGGLAEIIIGTEFGLSVLWGEDDH